MNPVPILIASLFAGIYFGWKAGYAAAMEEIEEMFEQAEGPSFVDVQREVAGLQ